MFQFEKHFGLSTLTTICAGLDAAAEVLGMTAEELSAEFREGKTLAQLAVEKGFNPTAVQQAVQVAIKAGPRAAIQQAAADGRLTQDNAEWLLQGLEKDYWGAGKILAGSPSLQAVPRAAIRQVLYEEGAAEGRT
ncbi:MAG TPA: hypothetical protein VLG46_15605 [Anaerolineae bacterium]|nr:hypothetical protein [Anaerolineae bacterium]